MIPELRVHLIGISGTGLSAIARVLLERGCQVSGSDLLLNAQASQLQAAGARILIGHRAENIQGADVVVRSSAVSDDNVEVMAAQAAGIPVLKRSEFLAQLIADQDSIAIAGSHGKTTTTAMLTWVLVALGLDPSYIIGGVSANLNTNAHAGQGQYFVIEADEYDRMFLGLHPSLAVVTNIEHDHPDCFPTPEDFYQVFVAFAEQVQPQGMVLIGVDDAGGRRLYREMQAKGKQVFSYGVHANNFQPLDYQAVNLRAGESGGLAFDVLCTLSNGFTMRPALSLQVPGEHNVANALATLAVVHQLGLPVSQATQALAAYQGTARRFELRGEANGVVIVDDYAHHPTQIQITLAAARQRFPGRRLWAVWQPHTYSRTRTLAAEFAQSFGLADQVVVTQIYASREAQPSDGFSASSVVDAMQHAGKYFIPELKIAAQWLVEKLQPGDVLLVFSAGDADQISAYVLAALQKLEESHVRD